MFTKIFKAASVVALSVLVFTACKSKEEKIHDDAVDVVTEKYDSIAAENPAASTNTEWTSFKQNAETAISNNDERIRTLKEKIAKPGMPNLDKLRKQRIEDLEKQNDKLRTKIAEYKADEANANWQQFKADVQQEIDKMNAELKDLDNDKK